MNFDGLHAALVQLFEVEALTILHGENYITCDAELEELLAVYSDASHIDLALYDAVDDQTVY